MITSVYFDDQVVVDGGRDVGEGKRGQLREFSFHRRDGWDIREALPGVFTLFTDGMEHPVTVGGYGYSCVRVTVADPHPFAEAEGPPEPPTGQRRRKR